MQRQVQSLAVAAAIVLAIANGQPARAADPNQSEGGGTRIVNVTSDSAPGWLPSADQARAARDAAMAYLAASDAGRAEAAYAMLDDGNRALQPFADFARQLASFNSSAGAIVERRIVNVTWTKDPAQAPKPGVYAAIDIVSRFANIDRDCGYVVVYQAPAGGPFLVAREEANVMTNTEAATIERQQSASAGETAWSQLAARCPNYPGESPQASSAPLPESADSIGYPTVAAALHDLRSKPGVAFRSENGFTIATDDGAHTIWMFTSEGQPAYPAAIKREFVANPQGGASVDLSVLCEASKADCDNLVRTFEALDARMAQELRGRR
jgi:hypothetical protein